MKFLKTLLIILIISVTFGGAMFGLNFLTGPRIEANKAGAELAPLLAVMPEGAEFGSDALLYSSENASASTLTNIPACVLSIYKEKNGLGFVVRATADSGYVDSPLVMTIGVTSSGAICGLQIDDYGTGENNWNGKYLTDDYIGGYIDKDSALAGVELIGGVTYSSTAFKNAVSEALGALIANDLIKAGVKSDAQILEELIPSVAPGFIKLTEVTPVSGNIQKALKAGTDAGFAYIMTNGNASYLVLVNAMGVCQIYDVEGNLVENDALATEAKAHAAKKQKSYTGDLTTRVGIMMKDSTDIQAVNVNTMSSIVAAVTFQHEGATYYAFYSRSYGFEQMDVYVILDANGAIVKVDAKSLIFHEEYFQDFDGVPEGYLGGYAGFTGETWTGDAALITGATITTNAMKEAVNDAFAAFNSIKGGQQ